MAGNDNSKLCSSAVTSYLQTIIYTVRDGLSHGKATAWYFGFAEAFPVVLHFIPVNMSFCCTTWQTGETCYITGRIYISYGKRYLLISACCFPHQYGTHTHTHTHALTHTHTHTPSHTHTYIYSSFTSHKNIELYGNHFVANAYRHNHIHTDRWQWFQILNIEPPGRTRSVTPELGDYSALDHYANVPS